MRYGATQLSNGIDQHKYAYSGIKFLPRIGSANEGTVRIAERPRIQCKIWVEYDPR